MAASIAAEKCSANRYFDTRASIFRLRSRLPLIFPPRLWLAYVDGCGIQRVLDVRGVKLLDHFDAGATVLRDLINVGSLHQAHTDVGVSEAVCRAAVAVTVALQAKFIQNRVEQFP